jgi:membrane-associated phospholipid phosphatase
MSGVTILKLAGKTVFAIARASVLAGTMASAGNANAGVVSDSDADNVRNVLLLSGVAMAGFHRDYQGLQQFGYSLLLTSGITLTGKALIDAERPNGEDNDSFPSGHAATAFAGAGFLHRRYGWKYGLPAYAVATSVAWSRVENEHHRWLDVAAGGLIALVVNRRLVTANTAIQAHVSPGNFSLGLQYRF